MELLFKAATALSVGLFAAMPASNSYHLNNYGFGSGGVGNAGSANYSMSGITGEVSGPEAASSSYKIRSGNNQAQQANVPLAPTIINPGSYYNKLRFIVNPSDNPSDATFALAISTDNFVTTQYIQSDDTIGPTLGSEDYQTYAAWGGSSGQLVIGLQPSTRYYIKAKAMTGKFTETAFGPAASEVTVPASLSFDIDVSATDQSTDPPYAISFGNLLPDVIRDGPEKVWVSVDTNADSGAMVYVSSENGGLKSDHTGHTLASQAGDLASQSEGIGLQVSSVNQVSGGPLAIDSPYDGTGQQVGAADTVVRRVLHTGGPVTSARSSILLKAKASASTPAADDYRDILTFIASAAF